MQVCVLGPIQKSGKMQPLASDIWLGSILKIPFYLTNASFIQPSQILGIGWPVASPEYHTRHLPFFPSNCPHALCRGGGLAHLPALSCGVSGQAIVLRWTEGAGRGAFKWVQIRQYGLITKYTAQSTNQQRNRILVKIYLAYISWFISHIAQSLKSYVHYTIGPILEMTKHLSPCREGKCHLWTWAAVN